MSEVRQSVWVTLSEAEQRALVLPDWKKLQARRAELASRFDGEGDAALRALSYALMAGADLRVLHRIIRGTIRLKT